MVPDIPPICEVKSCKEPCQIVSKKGDLRDYMKTCRRHDYTDLSGEHERVETFWAPTTN
jgi:hypothetical protein